MTKTLADRVAVITGAESGIGQAIAIECGRRGAAVIVNYLHDEDGAQKTKHGIEAGGEHAAIVQADVTVASDVDRLFGECRRQFGPATILINNAGVNGNGTHVADMPIEQWNKTIQTNLTGPFLCSQAFIRDLRGAGKGGVIVNISSIHEVIAVAGNADYDASKSGLTGLMRTLALEVAPLGIRVNNIGPGMILTSMNIEAEKNPKLLEERTCHIPLRRAGEPDEIAKLAAFVVSDEAAYMTGTTIFIDGGLMLNTGQGA